MIGLFYKRQRIAGGAQLLINYLFFSQLNNSSSNITPYASTANGTLAMNAGSENRGGELYAMIHMEDNDTCAMAALRADAGKYPECSNNGI